MSNQKEKNNNIEKENIVLDGFQNFGKKVEDVFQNIKEGIENSFNAIDNKCKEIKHKIWENKPEIKIRNQIRTNNKEISKKVDSIDEKVENVEDIATQIKQDTSQLLLNDAEILKMLEIIDYKADNLEASIAPLLPRLEAIIEKTDNLEDFLRDQLGSKWSKLKRSYQLLKTGEIDKKAFILTGFKILGKTFVSLFAKISA